MEKREDGGDGIEKEETKRDRVKLEEGEKSRKD